MLYSIQGMSNTIDTEDANLRFRQLMARTTEKLQRTEDYTGMENYALNPEIKPVNNNPQLLRSLQFSRNDMAQRVLRHYLSSQQPAKARAFFERFIKLIPTITDDFLLLRYNIEMAEGNTQKALATLDQIADKRIAYSALLKYTGELEKRNTPADTAKAVELAKAFFASLGYAPLPPPKTILNETFMGNWHGSHAVARYVAQTYMSTHDSSSSQKQYYYVYLAEKQAAHKSFAEAEKTIALITNDEALGNARIALALGLAADGQTDAAIKAAPAILWNNTLIGKDWSFGNTAYYESIWNKSRAEMVKHIAATHPTEALKLARQITAPDELTTAMIYLAQ